MVKLKNHWSLLCIHVVEEVGCFLSRCVSTPKTAMDRAVIKVQEQLTEIILYSWISPPVQHMHFSLDSLFKGTGTRDLIWLKVVSLDRSWLVGLTDDL